MTATTLGEATLEATPSGRKLLTVGEAASELRVCRTTLYQLMDSGKLQSVRIPGIRARRIRRSAIEQLIDAGTTGGDED